MPILIIGENERKRIAEIISYAKAHPISIETLRAGMIPAKATIKLADRKPEFERPPSAHVIFPGGFRAALSIEQQPAGLCTHLSISVFGRAKKGMMPSPEAVAMICKEFGVPFPPDNGWTEEFDPGEFAVNLVSILHPTPEGHA